MKLSRALPVVLLALASSASAKIGESMTQAIVRLGTPEQRLGDQRNATWTWKKENRVTTILFENNASTIETVTKAGTFTPKEVSDILARAATGAWQKSETMGNYTNGPLVAETKPWEVKIFRAPAEQPAVAKTDIFPPLRPGKDPETEPPAKVEPPAPAMAKIDPPGTVKTPVILNARQLGELDKQLTSERTTGLKRVYGKVVRSSTDGQIIQCSPESAYPGNVLVTGLRAENPILVGSLVEALVRGNATYQMRGSDGRNYNIPKVEFTGPIPALPE